MTCSLNDSWHLPTLTKIHKLTATRTNEIKSFDRIDSVQQVDYMKWFDGKNETKLLVANRSDQGDTSPSIGWMSEASTAALSSWTLFIEWKMDGLIREVISKETSSDNRSIRASRLPKKVSPLRSVSIYELLFGRVSSICPTIRLLPHRRQREIRSMEQ